MKKSASGPKTNPLTRALRIEEVNKRNQLKRDKANGLRRVELKVGERNCSTDSNDLARQQNMSRADCDPVVTEATY